jgi:hypothetical protein
MTFLEFDCGQTSPSELKSAAQLWAGGESYIASADLSANLIRKIYPIQARKVDRIEIGGGYVWVLFDRHLRRAALHGLK